MLALIDCELDSVMYYSLLLFNSRQLSSGKFDVRILYQTQHFIPMPLVMLQLPVLFSTPLTINAELGYLDQRTDKAADWRAENIPYVSKLQQEFLPRCKASREYLVPH